MKPEEMEAVFCAINDGICMGRSICDRNVNEFIKGCDLAASIRSSGWSNEETVSKYLQFSQHNIWK